ncbi:SPOR domain-containing protein [Loktanella sp. R86503]|uniref:SPOR domain-containing protein n=1 Tax=Loktanella sp. R86503 TaxID=3093847 RepID=UPI0036D86C71
MAVYDEAQARGSLTDLAGRYTQYAGAAVSLTLMIGVAVWGTKTILRDVSGVPVVRAMQGDMRVAPENPGGDVADHRGLAVNAVAGSGEAAAPEDTVTLAPRMLELAAEDLETAPLTDTIVDAADAAAAPASVPAADQVQDTAMAVPTGPMNADDILAMADQISAGITPMAPLDNLDEANDSPVMTLDGEPAAGKEDDITEIANMDAQDPIALALAEAMASDVAAPDAAPVAAAGAVRSVLRPTVRPLRAAPAVATATDLAAAPVTVSAAAAQDTLPSVAVLTDDLPVGTKLVQLGAFPTAEDASKEWISLQGKFGEMLAGKTQIIQEASSGGATFYRLRASGFDDLPAARQFCETLDASRAACTPVVVR